MEKYKIIKIEKVSNNGYEATEHVHSTALGSIVTIHVLEIGKFMQLERLEYEKKSEKYLITSWVEKIERRDNMLKVSTVNSRYYLDMEVR